jgi:DNA-binding SARP family transcriptional activator/outer membrane protein assembly factor BamB
MLEFRLLGTLDAGEEGSAALGGRKQRTLLAYLLLHRNEAIPRETLIDALWPEDPPVTAAHALDVYVSRLRKSIGVDGLLETRGGSILLNAPDEAVDAARFEQLVAAARRAEAPGDRLVPLEQALALWRGRALADLVDEPALRPECDRLEEERLVAQEERLEAMLALGRHDEAIGPLQALASEQPLRERPRRLLMLALYRAGRQSEALEVYRSFRRLLSDKLGLEPSADLRELEAAILRQDEALATPAPVEPAAAPLAPPVLPRRARRSRRAALVAIAAAVVVAAGATFAALSLSGGSSARPALTVPPLSAAAIDPATGRVVDVVPLPARPVAALAVGRTLWIASWADRTLTRLDDRTGAVLRTIGLPSQPLALASGAGRIWIASRDGDNSLTAVDLRSGNVLWSHPLHQPNLGVFSSDGWGANGIAFAAGSVWVTVGVSGLQRISPDGVLEHTFVVGPDPRPVVASDDRVWVAILGPEQLVEIDPVTDKVVAHVRVGAMGGSGVPAGPVPCTLAVSGQTVWAPAVGGGSSTTSGIWRVDALRGGFVSGVFHAGGNPCGVSLGHGEVWVTNSSSHEVDVIDPRTNRFLRRIPLDSAPNAIASAPEHVWVVTD